MSRPQREQQFALLEVDYVVSGDDGEEHELVLSVADVEFTPGYEGSWEEPGYNPGVDFGAVYVKGDSSEADLLKGSFREWTPAQKALYYHVERQLLAHFEN